MFLLLTLLQSIIPMRYSTNSYFQYLFDTLDNLCADPGANGKEEGKEPTIGRE